jgi:hypothetical protein
MYESEHQQRNGELVDISTNSPLGKAPLAKIIHLPRMGQSILLPLHRPGDWGAYTVVDVECDRLLEPSGMLKVTLYVQRSS